jgi:hypothetical protein
MSRIYIVTDHKGGNAQYVRALSLNGAIRAVAAQTFIAKIASTDEVYQAMKVGVQVLDALTPEQADIDDKDDPGPMPLRAV